MKMEAIEERKNWQSYSPESQDTIDSVLLPSQQFMVFQLAQKETSIQSDDGLPWLRCIGFSKTLSDARILASNAHFDGNLETRIMPCGRVFLAGAKKYKDLDLERRKEEQEKAHFLVDSHIEKRKQIHAATVHDASTKKVLDDILIQAEKPPPLYVPASLPSSGISIRDEASVKVVLQRVFALAIIPDPDNEPAVIPLFAMDTLPELQDAVRKAAKSKDLVHFDIFAASTGIWLPLSNPTSSQTFHHHPLRAELENNIKWEKC